jgi:7-keto-8-aminopelargonate synthetase-like enzyme
MMRQGFEVGGSPSPIVPVFVGDETLARVCSGFLTEQGLLANLVEFPAVAKGKARFRFQVMPTHSAETAEEAAKIMASAVRLAHEQINNVPARLNGKTAAALHSYA